MHKQIHGGIDKNIIVYHERLREVIEKSLTKLLSIPEEKACGIPYFLTFKKRDPMKKAIKEVQNAIDAGEGLQRVLEEDLDQFDTRCNVIFNQIHEVREKNSQLRECLATLIKLQEEKG